MIWQAMLVASQEEGGGGGGEPGGGGASQRSSESRSSEELDNKQESLGEFSIKSLMMPIVGILPTNYV